uniref:Putative lipocalin-5 1 n=1 Tax=Amblyomma parvum TaxID=251391 RepID=A0A023G2H3_AMBPA
MTAYFHCSTRSTKRIMQCCCLAVFVFAAFQMSLTLAQEGGSVPDSFVLFETFSDVVAISDSDNDTIFECMTASKIWFNKETKTAKFAWNLSGLDENNSSTLTFYIEEGSSPDTFLYRLNSADAQPEVGKFLYADYTTCGISDVPYHGRQCVLWVPKRKRRFGP